MFDAAWRRSPAPGTPIRSPHRRGRPPLRERPEQVGFAPVVPLALRLDPDPEQRIWYGSWRRKIELPACRLVWVGDAIPAPGTSPGWHVEVLVTPLTSSSDAPQPPVLTLPMSVLGLLTVGRVLEDPSQEKPAHGFGRPHRRGSGVAALLAPLPRHPCPAPRRGSRDRPRHLGTCVHRDDQPLSARPAGKI